MNDQQEEGWPLGLQPMNVRDGLLRNMDVYGSTSFNTLLLSGSPTSTDSSSDLDTESTGSFFHDKSTTLGSLMGVSRTTHLISRRSVRRKRPEFPQSTKKTCRPRTWCFSFCHKDSTEVDSPLVNSNNNVPCLGEFLEVERRAANEHRNSQSPLLYELELEQPECDSNSLFLNGRIAPPPPHSSPWLGSEGENNRDGLEQTNGYGAPMMLFPCLCGHN